MSAKKNRIKNTKNWFVFVAVIILVIYSASLIMPLLWAVMSSLKSRFDFLYNPYGFPEKLLFGNYLNAFKELKVPIVSGNSRRNVFLLEMFWNSTVYAVGFELAEQLSNAFCAYVCAKFSKKYRFPRIIYGIVLLKILIPIIGNLGATLNMYRLLGIYDNFFGIWFTSLIFGGTPFLVYYAVFKGISWEYAEAALVDGASHFRVLLQVMFPQAISTFIALFILGIIGRWNDYSAIMIFLPSTPTVAYGLFRYQFTNANAASSVPVQLAGCTLVILPMLLMFLVFNKKIMRNVAIGGLKG